MGPSMEAEQSWITRFWVIWVHPCPPAREYRRSYTCYTERRKSKEREREKEEINAVSVEVRGKRSLDPNKKRVGLPCTGIPWKIARPKALGSHCCHLWGGGKAYRLGLKRATSLFFFCSHSTHPTVRKEDRLTIAVIFHDFSSPAAKPQRRINRDLTPWECMMKLSTCDEIVCQLHRSASIIETSFIYLIFDIYVIESQIETLFSENRFRNVKWFHPF